MSRGLGDVYKRQMKCKELTEAAGKVLVELAEAQIRLVLTMPLARQLEASAPCRRLHGVLGEGKGYTCIRRFKVDEKSIGVHHAQRLAVVRGLRRLEADVVDQQRPARRASVGHLRGERDGPPD